MRLPVSSRKDMNRAEFLTFAIRSCRLKSRYGRSNVPIVLAQYARLGSLSAREKLEGLRNDSDEQVRENARLCLLESG